MSGIAVGELSLVKDCDVRNNGAGIFGRDRVQVDGCHVNHNEAFGIRVGDHCLIQRNEVNLNAFVDGALGGISGGEGCTVAHNVASNNGAGGIGVGAGGIDVGPKSLVTHNMANSNERLGISVVCPSTVTNNTATGNGLANYAFAGTGCHTNNNRE
jgi:hypothetical protein